jgi:formate/nitrite transporter FocA (FNT family)
MFLIPAAIFADALSWQQFVENFVAVFLGNAIGGAVFVGLAYYVSYSRQPVATDNSAAATSASQNL